MSVKSMSTSGAQMSTWQSCRSVRTLTEGCSLKRLASRDSGLSFALALFGEALASGREGEACSS